MIALIKRREFITLLGSAAAWPLAAQAQGPGRVYRLGVMVGQSRDSATVAAFFDELRLLGFSEGQNLAIVAGDFGLRDEQRPALAAEIVKLAPDVIWNIGSVIADDCQSLAVRLKRQKDGGAAAAFLGRMVGELDQAADLAAGIDQHIPSQVCD